MRLFRDEVCADCKGKKYPRQCRNKVEWREHKVRIFGDIMEVDFDCPYGVALNYLPPREPRKEPIQADLCLWATVVSCLSVKCRHEAGTGLVLGRRHCGPSRCRFYEVDSTGE